MHKRSSWIVAGVVFALAVILGLIALALIGVEVGASGFFIGLVMAAVPVPFYVAFALWVDRFEPEPNLLLVLAFFWGAAIAVFFSLVFNVINAEVFGAALASVISAPFVEELTKGTALFLLFLWKRDEFDNVTDGIVYASMVGLGFAMTENVQYYGTAAAHAGAEAVGVFIIRGIMGPFAHPLFTSMTGIGLGIARESGRPVVKALAPIGGLLLAMLLHGIWNLSASSGLTFFAAYFVVMVPAFIAVIVVAIFSLRREANLIRTHLANVVAEGVLDEQDLAVVTSVRRRIAVSAAVLTQRGFAMWSARRRFHALAAELAFHSWRCSREATPDAQATRAALANEIRALRTRLGLGAVRPELVVA